MTSRERRTFFERLYAMREAYTQLEATDRTGIMTITDAITAAELELERPAAEPETVLGRPMSTLSLA